LSNKKNLPIPICLNFWNKLTPTITMKQTFIYMIC